MNSYYLPEEQNHIDQFEKSGYIIFEADHRELLDEMREQVFAICRSKISLADDIKVEDFFDQAHNYISVEQLNDLRLHVIRALSENDDFKLKYYRLGSRLLHQLVGNELAAQRVCNLSIQLPGDTSSLLPLHSDVWSGNSPYEVVMWLPMVSCYKTKSMYFVPREESEKVCEHLSDYQNMSSEEFYQSISDKCVFLDVPYGHAVIFSHAMIHGNRVNEEGETRWSFNFRFKSLLSPYGNKALGETFLPITTRPLTRLGLEYRQPRLKNS